MRVKKRDIDSYLHEDAGKWLGSSWGLKQNSIPVPTPNLIFKVPAAVDRNQLGRLTITQRVRLARLKAAKVAEDLANGIMTLVHVLEKRCNLCQTVKPAAEYGSDRGKNDGLQRYCKVCRRKATNERYQRKKLEQKEMPIFKGTLEALKNL